MVSQSLRHAVIQQCGYSPASHHGDAGSILGHSITDLKWTKWYWN